MGEKEFDKIKGAISLAREVGSLSPTDTTLQSHGKIQGMDAFSWHNPNIFVLDKTKKVGLKIVWSKKSTLQFFAVSHILKVVVRFSGFSVF